MSDKKRKDRLVSREFRDILGARLRTERMKLNYSISDVAYMTTIPVNTINTIEKGNATNIDYYIEYAKAVKFDLGKLSDFGIKLIPQVELPADRTEATKLTSKIREHIIEGSFLQNGKTVDQIRDELAKLKQIDINVVTSTSVAGVMRNLLSDYIVKVGDKDGRKNVYVKIK